MAMGYGVVARKQEGLDAHESSQLSTRLEQTSRSVRLPMRAVEKF